MPLLDRATWTSRTQPSRRSQSCLSNNSSNLFRTGVKTTAETPETTHSTLEVVETNETSKVVDENDLLADLTEIETTGMDTVGVKDGPIENETTDLVDKTVEEKEGKDIDPLRNNHHGQIKDLPLSLTVGNWDMITVSSNVQNSEVATFVRDHISITSARKESNENHLPKVRRIRQTGFRAVLGQTRERPARRRSWGSEFF